MKPTTYRIVIAATVEPEGNTDKDVRRTSRIDLFLDAKELETDYAPELVAERLRKCLDLLGHDITKNLDALHGESK